MRRSGFASLCLVLCTALGCNDAPPPPGEGVNDAGPGADQGCGPPADEVCNGADDDCDGRIDEQVDGLGERCGMAGCGVGSTACEDGQIRCVGEGAPTPETCNGEDDDCDGTVDEDAEGVGEACPACEGTFRCQNGDLICSGGSPETCNGQDDDCDGREDEMLTRPCGDDTGACQPGTETCQMGAWSGCIGGTGPNGEACNGLDDDCDNTVDEGLADCAGLGSPCGNDGQCPSGLCLDDDGSFYCSRPCDASAADDCGEGYRCVEIDGRAACIPEFEPCTTDCDCDEGLTCMPANNLEGVERACRPERRDGLPVGAECEPRGSQCATGTCLGRMRRCGRLCCDGDSCGDDAHCVSLPGLDQTVCVTACTADDDCPMRTPPPPGEDEGYSQEICRYRPDAEMTRNVGICDWPNQMAVGLGEQCERGGDCAHGLCWQPNNGENYCTKGCEDPADCPDGWDCRPSMLNGLDVSICRQ